MIDEPTVPEQAMVPFEGGPGAPREIALTPREVLNAAKEQAEVLMELVGQKHLSTRMGQSEHLHAEAWITIAAFNNIVAKTKWVKPEHDENGKVSGYEAEVELLHTPTGEIRGGAIMSCGLDAFPCQSKRGSEKDKAAKSAAQTWAAAKAIRMTLSYVPVLAGYSPVPYEEMQASVAQPAERNESAPFCNQHGVSFRKFEKDNRTWHSHRQDSEPRGWCNYKGPTSPRSDTPDGPGSDFDGGPSASEPSEPMPWGESTPEREYQPADPLQANKATWEPFMVKVKAERGNTAKEDLAQIIEGGSSPKVLRANALRHGLKTPDELFALCTEQWAIRDSDTLFPED